MMRRFMDVLPALLLALGLCTPLSAQTQTGIVEGKIQGRLKPTGIRPKFVEKFEVMGINLPPGVFGFTY